MIRNDTGVVSYTYIEFISGCSFNREHMTTNLRLAITPGNVLLEAGEINIPVGNGPCAVPSCYININGLA
jgi:hypothetical protein